MRAIMYYCVVCLSLNECSNDKSLESHWTVQCVLNVAGVSVILIEKWRLTHTLLTKNVNKLRYNALEMTRSVLSVRNSTQIFQMSQCCVVIDGGTSLIRDSRLNC